MPSRMTFPPPNFTSSPYVVKSFSTSTRRSVSASRTLSPTVGPNICAYAARLISCGMALVLQRTHHLLVEPEHAPRAAVGHEPHLAGLARLEPHRRSRRDVEAISECRVSIERERSVRFSEVKVTANLNRPVASVGDREHDGRPSWIQENLAGSRKKFPWYHVSVTITTTPPNAATAKAARSTTLGIERLATQHSPMPAMCSAPVARISPAEYAIAFADTASARWAWP